MTVTACSLATDAVGLASVVPAGVAAAGIIGVGVIAADVVGAGDMAAVVQPEKASRRTKASKSVTWRRIN